MQYSLRITVINPLLPVGSYICSDEESDSEMLLRVRAVVGRSAQIGDFFVQARRKLLRFENHCVPVYFVRLAEGTSHGPIRAQISDLEKHGVLLEVESGHIDPGNSEEVSLAPLKRKSITDILPVQNKFQPLNKFSKPLVKVVRWDTDSLSESGSVLTDTASKEISPETPVEITFSWGDGRDRFCGMHMSSIDPPVLGFYREPEGSVDLDAYDLYGLGIINKQYLSVPGDGVAMGEVPRIRVNLRDDARVRYAYMSTRRLAEKYGLVLFICHPPLNGEWDETRSMATVKGRLSEATARSSIFDPADRVMGAVSLDTIHRQYLFTTTKLPTNDRQKYVTNDGGVRLRHEWDGIYHIRRSNVPTAPYTQGDRSVDLCKMWESSRARLGNEVNEFEGADYLLSPDVRQALKNLPNDLMGRFNGSHKQPFPVYAAGVDANEDGRSIVEILGHPLAKTIGSLPQGIVLGAMYHHILRSQGQHFPSDSEYRQMQIDVEKSCGGTAATWSYAEDEGKVFAMHQGDALVPSANVMISGSPRVWIAISHEHFQTLLRKLHLLVLPCFLAHRTMFIHPRFLVKHKIPFTVARQSVGDLIVTDARACREGWNTGQNFSVAANFLDHRTAQYLMGSVMKGDTAPWHCICEEEPLPLGVPRMFIPQAIAGLCHYHDPDHGLVSTTPGSAIFSWVRVLAQVMKITPEQLMSDQSHQYSRYSHLYRWLYGRRRDEA